MQAILTKYKGPTNSTGSRMIASAAAGRIVVGYDHALTTEENHTAAAEALRVKLEWYYGPLASGTLPNGDYCHVFTR